MFAGIINQTKSAVSSLGLKYVARARGVPFVIAAGFGSIAHYLFRIGFLCQRL